MEPSVRQQGILAELRQGDYVEVKALARRLGVDGSTIRRDLQAIGREHEIERFHGGVRIRQTGAAEPSASRAHLAIARGARRLLDHDQTLVLGGGPIADQLVPLLRDLRGLQVMTTNLRLAENLDAGGGIGVRLAGGELHPGTGETAGESAARAFDRVEADWSLVEVQGVHPFAGLTVDSAWRVATLRAMVGAGHRRCVLATSSAFDDRRIGFVAEVAVADLLVTDEWLDDASLPAYEGRVVRTSLGADGSGPPAGDHDGAARSRVG